MSRNEIDYRNLSIELWYLKLIFNSDKSAKNEFNLNVTLFNKRDLLTYSMVQSPS